MKVYSWENQRMAYGGGGGTLSSGPQQLEGSQGQPTGGGGAWGTRESVWQVSRMHEEEGENQMNKRLKKPSNLTSNITHWRQRSPTSPEAMITKRFWAFSMCRALFWASPLISPLNSHKTLWIDIATPILQLRKLRYKRVLNNLPKPQCCTPETNILLNVNCNWKK